MNFAVVTTWFGKILLVVVEGIFVQRTHQIDI